MINQRQTICSDGEAGREGPQAPLWGVRDALPKVSPLTRLNLLPLLTLLPLLALLPLLTLLPLITLLPLLALLIIPSVTFSSP